MTGQTQKREVMDVVEADGKRYILMIRYDEDMSADALGHVYLVPRERERATEEITQVLATSDTLRAIWASPSGALWVASDYGNVGTTASVHWRVPPAGAQYKTLGPSPAWSATELPAVRGSGLPPSISVLWGTGDDDVYAAANGGHIYHWNGQEWRQVFDGADSGNARIHAFGGTAPDNIFAVGARHTILHFDGRQWRTLAAPSVTNENEGFTGVHCLPNGDAFISSAVRGGEGRLLFGGAGGFSEFTRCGVQLIGMAALGERILFAIGDGIAELFGRDVRVIKDNFKSNTITSGMGRILVTEPAQKTPAYIEYDPQRTEVQWFRFKF